MERRVAIEVEQVCKRYPSAAAEDVSALDHVSFVVGEGEIVSIVGQSGCGKSTLLNLIAGFERPDHGAIRRDGVPVELPSKQCAMLFQQYGLLPWRSVLHNVELGLDHLPASERKERAIHYLRLVGLEDRARSFPHQLSGGMQQRVALARALAVQPRYIVMDEPFAALDTFTRYHLQNELLHIHASEGTTIVLVTHDIDEAVYVSDRVLIMRSNPGRLHKELVIPTSRPRDRGHADFQHYRKLILEEFRLSGTVPAVEYVI